MSMHMPPDKAVLATFVDAVFRHADPRGYVVYKAFDSSDRPVFPASGCRVGHAMMVEFAFNHARQAANCNRTAVFCPPVCTFKEKRDPKARWTARTEDLAEGLTISVDADKTPAAARETLTGLLGAPTVTAASGGLWTDPETGELQDKLHLHWRLREPTRTAERHALLHEARWLACMIVGGDVTLAPIVHPLRWPGSVHTKGEAKLARIIDLSEAEVDLDEAVATLRGAWKGPAFGTIERARHETTARVAEHDDIVSACATIPNTDLPWNEWKRIGMAIWAATEGAGFEIFDAWSRKSEKYGEAETALAWRKIDRSPPSEIGAGSLFHLANQADSSWVRPSQRINDGDFAELAAMSAVASLSSHRLPSDEFVESASLPIAAKPAARPRSTALPDALTRVPGLLGEMVDWIVETDRRPNRALALAAALTALGTIVGRRLAGPTLSGTHLYVIGLAPSGAGKDHGLDQAARLIKATNQDHLVGPSEFMSQTALVRFIHRQPLSLCLMDELGAFLKRLAHKRASPHEQGITKILRSAWGASFKTLRTPEWSGQVSEEIQNPALSIYGVSTPEEFFGAIQGGDVSNGFLNRFLLIDAERGPMNDRPSDPFKVPQGLRNALIDVHRRANILDASVIDRPWDDLRPTVLPWLAGAEEIYRALEDEIEPMRDDPEVKDFWARTAEMAVRLATIRAAGDGMRGVTIDDMAWGRDVALWSTRRLVEAADEHMAENEFQGDQKKVLALMRRVGKPVTRRDMHRGIRTKLDVQGLEKVIAVLVASGQIVAMSEKRKPGAGRPPPTHYRLP